MFVTECASLPEKKIQIFDRIYTKSKLNNNFILDEIHQKGRDEMHYRILDIL
jgi:hypothetical protein